MNGYKITNQNALHFLTFTVVGWVDIFTREKYRKIIIESLRFCQKEKGLVICAYVIMSNHMHIICFVHEPNLLSDVVRDFKKFTSKAIISEIQNSKTESRRDWMLPIFSEFGKANSKNKEFQLWQQHNMPIELVSPKWINQKLSYIHLNPVRNGIVENDIDYIYSSASNYAEKPSLLDVHIMDLGNTIGYIEF